jgi:AAA domain
VIRDRSEELHAFHARHFAERVSERPASTNGHHSEFTDEEVIRLAKSAKNTPKFETLWSGDVNGYPSDSEADQALVSLLAFYTQDEEQLDRLYRQSGLCRQKWLDRPDYRRRTITRALSNLRETYTPDDGARMIVGNGNLVSRRPVPIGDGTRDTGPEVVRLAEVERPGPRRYLCQDLVLAAYVTLLHGDGGVAKSLLALALAVAVAGSSQEWLGRRVENGRVLYLDFELDAEEQARRVHQLCYGAGLENPPEDLLYMSAVGYTPREAFEAAREACEQYNVEFLIVDSYGVALHGDAEHARDVIGFHQEYLEPLRALGIAVLVIDHQSRLQAGQSYQQKGAFGSVYKANLARSVIQVEATERGEGTLTVRLRQKKHNFGPLAEPFSVKLTFSDESVTLEAVELKASELAEEATLTAPERVKLALEDGPAYPWEIAETTGVQLKTVKNVLTGLRKQGVVEPTGQTEGQAEQVRLSVPRPDIYRDGTRDTSVIESERQVFELAREYFGLSREDDAK